MHASPLPVANTESRFRRGIPTHSALDTYEYESGNLLECPIFSFGGKKDGEQKMENWAMESSSAESDSMQFEGGSFFFLDRDNEAGVILTYSACSVFPTQGLSWWRTSVFASFG